MKKVLWTVLTVIFISSVNAQEISIGPKVGFNVTNITNEIGSKNKISFLLGGFAEFRFTDFFAIQPELLYSRQGYRVKTNGIKAKTRVNYLNIPVLAKLYVWDALSVDLGPQLGFALNGRYKNKDGSTVTKTDIGHLNTVDLSWALGASYELDMGLILSARYNFGITNVRDKDVVGENNKNHVFQLSAGWRFSDLF